MKNLLLVCVITGVVGFCFTDDINFNLSSYNPIDPSTTVFKQYHNFSSSLSWININNIGDNVGFIIVQVHSYLQNVTLYSSVDKNIHSKVMGTNIGLIYAQNNSSANFILTQDPVSNLKVLVVVSVYRETDPVPGGCNLVFNNKVAPYQMIHHTDEIISVDFQAPSGYGVDCDNNTVEIEKYHLFLPEYDITQKTYFKYLEKMLTVEGIEEYGYRVRNDEGYFKYKTLYSIYRGTGEVFAIIARYKNASSAYIPAISYACDYLEKYNETCVGPLTTHWKYVCATALIIGIFVLIAGHYFFKCSITVTAFATGVLFTYIILSLIVDLSFEEKSTTSLIFGLLYAIGWVYLWYKLGIPIISICLTTLLAGYLIASIIFYTPIVDLPVFNNNINFYLVFLGITTATILIVSPLSCVGHIFACSFLGSYAVVATMSYYTGGYLQYISINTVRRFTVKNFNRAIIDPPYQIKDIIMTIVWVLIFFIGHSLQNKIQRGRPPFPSTRQFNTIPVDAAQPDERTPLIVPEYV